MDAKDCSVIDRHFSKLQQCLEPAKLLRYLERVGVLDEDDVDTVRQEKIQSSREKQVETFIDILKRREHGFRHLLKALLTSKVQDFLARELLEDNVYNEEEISIILTELESDLDETQRLKLRLIEEQKRHRNVAKELEDVKRSSIIYSDSGSSGLFADYDSTLSGDEGELISYSPRGLEPRRLSREEEQSMPGFTSRGIQNRESPPPARNEEFEWEHEDGWRGFGSVDHLDVMSKKRNKIHALENLWKSASLGRLNDILEEQQPRHSQRGRFGFTKWNSEECVQQRSEASGSINREENHEQTSPSVEEKLAALERQLQDEKRKRQVSENEVAKLQLQKEGLYEELEDTREQLRVSHLNLYYEDDDFEEELCFEDEDVSASESRDMYEQRAVVEKKIRFSPDDCHETAAHSRTVDANQLQSQTDRMRTTRLTGSWRKVNAQFYELDEYDNEIKVEMDATNILDTLRRLKTYTSCLYNDILSERDELEALKKRASRLESN